jgi:hypothetical protein
LSAFFHSCQPATEIFWVHRPLTSKMDIAEWNAVAWGHTSLGSIFRQIAILVRTD